ncbi:cysteine desulfurase family protein [Jeotgalibacillus soli]|uniref:Cysteine desulfurase n=1 Tax=Jeotgalibacillus soli TaxID=889306 RepID=A0A0C2VH77_9BACL|nr:cysteine desulfurase family protein [Jeotgalibacillus soli]KIL43861.1 cysteine desulfurase [Jeotgalibacillus soli]
MIYLDNSATTRPYEEVLSSFLTVSQEFFGNPSSLHQLGEKASSLLEKSREQAASILEVDREEILFTSGGTESNNLAIKGIARANRHRGNHIITTAVEHPSVYNAVLQLKDEGFDITILPVDRNGMIDTEYLKNALTQKTILVSIMHVNNEVGTVQPIKEAGAIIKEYSRAFFHVDHIQGFGKVPLNIRQAKIDLLSLSAHKFHGLKGTGLLFIKKGLLLREELAGGDQEAAKRSGTENVAGIVSMAKAMRMTVEQAHRIPALSALRQQLIKTLTSHKKVTLVSPMENGAPHIICVSVPGLRGEVIVQALQKESIYLSTTSACSSKKQTISRTIEAMACPSPTGKGSVRISFSLSTTAKEIEMLMEAWNRTILPLMEVIKSS